MFKEQRIKNKRRRFNALLHVTKMAHVKMHILNGYGVESTTELHESDLDNEIRNLESQLQQQKEDAPKEIRRWRHKCLRIIGSCDVDTADWNDVNAFLMQPRLGNRVLYDYKTVDELKKLHRQLNAIADNKKVKAERISKQIQNN